MFFSFVFQKTLWDTIKNKRGGENVSAPRRQITDRPLKMAANKTFQVSRKSQYKREKLRSPLASLNEFKAVRERSLSKHGPTDENPQKSEEQKTLSSTQNQRSRSLPDQENIYRVQRNSPLDLLVPAATLMDCGSVSARPDVLVGKPENRDLTKMLNKTLSPIGTPERFKKPMPHICSDSPLSFALKSVAEDADSALTGTPVLSLKDALALIDSDLSHINASPLDSSSSCGFSDSLESKSGSRGCGPDGNFVKELPDSPQGCESSEQRLTFFVSKNLSEVVVSEPEKAPEKVKKASFTSATVTKSKAPVEANASSGRKIKKSRRRLLERTIELSDGNSESGPGTPNLPVIDPDTGAKGLQDFEAASSLCDDKCQGQEFISSSLDSQLDSLPSTTTFPVTSPPSMAPAHFSFSVTSPPPVVNAPSTFIVTSPLPLGSSSPLHLNLTSNPKVYELSPTVSAPPLTQADLFPIHMAAKNKKRKSEGFLEIEGKIEIEDAGKTGHVKRSRVVAGGTESSRWSLERSTSQRQQARTAGEQI